MRPVVGRSDQARREGEVLRPHFGIQSDASSLAEMIAEQTPLAETTPLRGLPLRELPFGTSHQDATFRSDQHFVWFKSLDDGDVYSTPSACSCTPRRGAVCHCNRDARRTTPSRSIMSWPCNRPVLVCFIMSTDISSARCGRTLHVEATTAPITVRVAT